MKKWWWSLFLNILNASVTAAWRLYQMANPTDKMTHIHFHHYITVVLVKSGGESIKDNDRRSSQLPREIRLDNVGHIVEETKQGRCRICKINTRKRCSKCEVQLHTDRGKPCWYKYHNDPEL